MFTHNSNIISQKSVVNHTYRNLSICTENSRIRHVFSIQIMNCDKTYIEAINDRIVWSSSNSIMTPRISIRVKHSDAYISIKLNDIYTTKTSLYFECVMYHDNYEEYEEVNNFLECNNWVTRFYHSSKTIKIESKDDVY